MTRHSLKFLAATAAALGFGAPALASTPNTPLVAVPAATTNVRAPRPITRTEFLRNLDANYKRLDANNDGGVTQAEVQAAQARAEQAVDAAMIKRRDEAFRRLDTNKDGQLSLAEFNAGSPIAPRPRANPGQVIQRMDVNKDQKVSPAEFRAPSLAMFDKMDLNRDGTVSVDEQKKARPAAR